MNRLVRSLGLCLLGMFALLHCGGGGKSGEEETKPTPVPVILSFAANPVSIAPGGSSTVSWSVTGATSLSIDHGAPAISGASGFVSVSPAATTQYTLTATNAKGSSTATATVTVTPAQGVTVSVSPASATVQAAHTQAFTATVTGATNTAVTWSVQEASGGAVDATGLYTAPATAGTYHVKATSVADTSKSATATVTVTAAPPVVAVSISPASATVQATHTQAFTATVTGTTNTAVTWSVQEASGGAVDASGLYTAPATAGAYHVKATSAADTSKSATATVTVTAGTAAPVISAFVANPSTIAAGGSSVLSWTVTGATSLNLSGVGTVTGKVSETVSPSSTTTYVLTATGPGGIATASATLTVTGGNPPSQWVMGYYVGYHRGLQTPAQVDYSAMTHIVVGRAVPRPDGTWNTTFDIDEVNGPAWAKDAVQRAHAAGIKALLMLGGAGANGGFEPTHDPAVRARAVDNLKAIVDQYGFDGVDFDWENYNILNSGGDVIAYLKAIKAAMPNGILTMPVGWNNSNFNPLQNSHYAEIGGLVDRINMMTYGMFWGGSGWLSWHMAPLDGAKGATPSSLVDSVKVLASSGISNSKIGIGFGFYGYAYQGGPDTSLPSAPGQNTDQIDIIGVYNSADNILSYSHLLQYCIKPDLTRWDDLPQSTYLSFPQATTLAIPSSSIRTRYLTYEDERSIAAKGNWARAQGLGGVIIWTISEGYLPWRTTGEKDPLMKVVKAALLSPQGAPQILTFTASASSVAAGQPVTLSWNAPNTTSVSIDHGVAAITGTTGSIAVNPSATTSYTLGATNTTGAVVTAVCTVTVH
ncbi:MAG: hypothetical protein HY014_18440 [Acidobacteria bacterium]|nr:hypothetical protein [Acidobacteriota bacterium]MBI3490118.1 hypothetical protein [Acidobacteriota bacterium]